MKGHGNRAQSATEYLLTYGWAFLIAAIVIASLYLFVFAPSTLTPSSCTFSAGAFCQDLILGSSSSLSKMAMLLTNSNPYPIINPGITVNVSGIAPVQGTCVPNFVLPGGAIICSATITPAISRGALASGSFVLSYTPCSGGNATECQGNSRQSYSGSYNTHVSPLLSPTDISITLTAQNSSQVALSNSLDKLSANVRLLGTPISGATVNFTSNSVSAPIVPLVVTSDGSGNAVSYISSSTSENVFVTATFANVVANTLVTFTPPVCYFISVPGLSGATSNAITIDGVGYSSFPQQLCYGKGTSHTYSFQTAVSGAAGTQYLFNFASGCGQTSQSGTISSNSNCTLFGNYLIQYFLTTAASPGAGGTVTPSSGWYNAGSSATLGETPNAGYAFNGFTGMGSGSYTGVNSYPSITLNNPITETGSFVSTSSTTTSTTSTTSTIYPITYNPTSGTYSGDVSYTANTQLTGTVTATNDIFVQPGVVLDECNQYIQANVALYNSGMVNNTCGGGYGGSEVPGGLGSVKTSHLFGIILVSGAGGAGGGAGGTVIACYSGCYAGGGAGGVGGKGGGIVEIYASNLINSGTISAAGITGSPGSQGGFSSGAEGTYAWGGGGGGGQGGSGGTVFYAYTTLLNTGAVRVNGGYNAAGAIEGCSVSACGASGSAATIYGGGNGGGGYPGGIENQTSGNIIARTWP